jgi:hypothetical protein
MAKTKPCIPPADIIKTAEGPSCVPNVVVSRETVHIVNIGKPKNGVITWKLRIEREQLSQTARQLFGKADRMPPGTLYQQHGVRPVPYFYRDPRTKVEGRISIGRMLQDRALAVRVFDDQLKMALAHANLYGRVGRAHVARVRVLAKILGIEKRFEEGVDRLRNLGTRATRRVGRAETRRPDETAHSSRTRGF